MRLRRRSSSCSEKCSFKVFVLPLPNHFEIRISKFEIVLLTPQGLGGNHVQVFLMNGLLASRGDGPEENPSVEDPLEQISLAPGGFELRLAVSPRDGLEFHTPGSNTTPHGRHELAVAAIE